MHCASDFESDRVNQTAVNYTAELSTRVVDALRSLAPGQNIKFSIEDELFLEEFFVKRVNKLMNSLDVRNSIRHISSEEAPGKFTYQLIGCADQRGIQILKLDRRSRRIILALLELFCTDEAIFPGVHES